MSARALIATALLVALFAAAVGAMSCSAPARNSATEEPATSEQVAAAWEEFRSEFISAYLRAQPDLAVTLGRHEMDGAFPDWSREGLAAWANWLRTSRDTALEFPEEELSRETLFERDYLVARVDADLIRLDDLEWPVRSPLFYVRAFDPSVYLVRPYAALEERMEAYARLAEGVPEAAARVRGNLSGPLSRPQLEVGLDAFTRLIELIRDGVPEAFRRVSNADLQERVRLANAASVTALSGVVADLAGRLEDESEEAFSLGPERFGRFLWATERLDISPGTLAGVGNQDLDRGLRDLEELCRGIDEDLSVASCIEIARARTLDFNPLLTVQSGLDELRRRLDHAKLVTVPDSSGVRVGEGTGSTFVGSIDLPGPFEVDGILATYMVPGAISPEDLENGAVQGRAQTDLLLASTAAVWPGRYLQTLHSNRVDSEVGRVFVGEGLARGWAHYSEELAVTRIWSERGQLLEVAQVLGTLLQSSRLTVSIGIHAEGMTVEQAATVFVERAFLDEESARWEAVQCAADPDRMKAALGRALILRLRDDWLAVRGAGEGDLVEFHDALLSFGGPPLMLLRKMMVPEVDGSAF